MTDTPRTDFVAHESGDAEWNRFPNKFGRMTAHAQILERELAALHQCLRNVYEVWAGSEGIPAPTVASEAYLLSLVEQMRDAAKEGLNGG